jgi:hypothetical protein
MHDHRRSESLHARIGELALANVRAEIVLLSADLIGSSEIMRPSHTKSLTDQAAA